MGMFDWVICEYPLPEVPSQVEPGWQTKTFQPAELAQYRITIDGRLLKRDKWNLRVWEHGGDPEDKTAKWTDQNYHGLLNFYTSDDETNEWVEYNAKFTDGRLVSVELIPGSGLWGGSDGCLEE